MSKKANIFDVIAASAPVNTAAARAANMRGETYEKKLPDTERHWKSPPKCVSWPKEADPSHNLIGRRFGKLTVIGYYSVGKKARWLVRCICGDYEVRSSRAVKNPENNGDCCKICQHTIHLRTKDLYLKVGEKRADEIRQEERRRGCYE